MTTLDLRGRLTLTIPEAGVLLGVGRDAAYRAAEDGALKILQVGRRKVVPTHSLLKQLGMSDEQIAIALGLTPESAEAGSPEPATATVHQLTSLRSGDPQHASEHPPGSSTPTRHR
jgi:excisionase family DNA binding protein